MEWEVTLFHVRISRPGVLDISGKSILYEEEPCWALYHTDLSLLAASQYHCYKNQNYQMPQGSCLRQYLRFLFCLLLSIITLWGQSEDIQMAAKRIQRNPWEIHAVETLQVLCLVKYQLQKFSIEAGGGGGGRGAIGGTSNRERGAADPKLKLKPTTWSYWSSQENTLGGKSIKKKNSFQHPIVSKAIRRLKRVIWDRSSRKGPRKWEARWRFRLEPKGKGWLS